MNEKEFSSCWEYMNCPENIKTTCQVFIKNMGSECWFIMSLKKSCPASIKYGSCFACPWYKNHNE